MHHMLIDICRYIFYRPINCWKAVQVHTWKHCMYITWIQSLTWCKSSTWSTRCTCIRDPAAAATSTPTRESGPELRCRAAGKPQCRARQGHWTLLIGRCGLWREHSKGDWHGNVTTVHFQHYFFYYYYTTTTTTTTSTTTTTTTTCTTVNTCQHKQVMVRKNMEAGHPYLHFGINKRPELQMAVLDYNNNMATKSLQTKKTRVVLEWPSGSGRRPTPTEQTACGCVCKLHAQCERGRISFSQAAKADTFSLCSYESKMWIQRVSKCESKGANILRKHIYMLLWKAVLKLWGVSSPFKGSFCILFLSYFSLPAYSHSSCAKKMCAGFQLCWNDGFVFVHWYLCI